MSIKTIEIPAYKAENNLVRHSIKIAFDDVDIEQSFESNYDIDLYNLEIGSKIIIPRETTKTLTISLAFKWEDEKGINNIKSLISKDENPYSTANLRVNIYSPYSKYSLDQKVINLQELNVDNSFVFKVDLNKVFGSLIIEYIVTRDVEINGNFPEIADKPLSILSSNKEIEIIIDDIESERLNRSFLPISPADTGHLLFQFEGMENSGSDLPEIHYHLDFDNYFKQDDLLVVDTTFMFAFLSFTDNYLKWLLFKSTYNDQSKQYLSLVDFIAETLEVRSAELKDIIVNRPDGDDLIEKYLSYSKTLFENFQIKKKYKYKKYLKALIDKEKRLKILNK